MAVRHLSRRRRRRRRWPAVRLVGGLPALDHRPEGGGVVGVLLVGELHVARVVQHGDVVRLVDGTVAGVLHPVLNAADPPAPLLVAHAPRVGKGVHRLVGPLGHERGDPVVDLVGTVEGAEGVLEVDGVVGEQIGPVPPFPAGRAPVRRLLEVLVGPLEFVPAPRAHDFSIHSLIVTLRKVLRSVNALISSIIWVTWAFIVSASPSAQ